MVGGDSVPALPFFGTYKYFSFGGRFSVAPPPTAPFVPESAPLLLQFNATESRGDGVIPTGEIGPSKEYLDSGCFGFGARGVSLGCDSTDAPCDWQITGVRRSATGIDEEVVTQRASTSPCPTGNGCDLTELILLDRFRDLVKLRINVTVDGEAADWYADNFVLEWADKSCTAAICRSVQVILDDSCETGLCRSNEGEGGPSVR